MEDILNKLFEKKDSLFTMLATILASYEGASAKKLSANYINTLFHLLSGGLCSVHQEEFIELVAIEGGNSKLPEKIAEKLGESLHLNSPLVRIMKGKEGNYELIFESSQIVKADLLILAVPCPVFKQIEFGKGIIEPDSQKPHVIH